MLWLFWNGSVEIAHKLFPIIRWCEKKYLSLTIQTSNLTCFSQNYYKSCIIINKYLAFTLLVTFTFTSHYIIIILHFLNHCNKVCLKQRNYYHFIKCFSSYYSFSTESFSYNSKEKKKTKNLTPKHSKEILPLKI